MKMSKFEKKFGKYALSNLTIILILCYIVGYLLPLMVKTMGGGNGFLIYLTLEPFKIMNGEVWRIFTWLVIPPEGLSIFTVIMLFFYYSVGTMMERTLGDYKYNVYIFRGILLTVIGSFLCYAILYFSPTLASITAAWYPTIPQPVTLSNLSLFGSLKYSTYYINIAIFMAFAICYPDMQVLFMFVIPVKVKWLGILDLVILVYNFLFSDIFTKFAIGAALINIAIFYFEIRNLNHLRPKEVKRRVQYKQQVRSARPVAKHKCAICGQTDDDNAGLEFRFCSKCNGNYEYCQQHLFTHEHVK